MKYLLWTAMCAGVALGEDVTHDQFDAPAVSTMVAIGTGLVGVAILRGRRRQG